MAIKIVELPLTNTSASVWFAKKLYPNALPAVGQAVGRYFVIQHANQKRIFGWGGIMSLDGVALSKKKNEESFNKSYK